MSALFELFVFLSGMVRYGLIKRAIWHLLYQQMPYELLVGYTVI